MWRRTPGSACLAGSTCRREVIWATSALSKHPRFANNVRNNLSGVSLMLRRHALRKTDRTRCSGCRACPGEAVDDPDRTTPCSRSAAADPVRPRRIAADYL